MIQTLQQELSERDHPITILWASARYNVRELLKRQKKHDHLISHISHHHHHHLFLSVHDAVQYAYTQQGLIRAKLLSNNRNSSRLMKARILRGPQRSSNNNSHMLLSSRRGGFGGVGGGGGGRIHQQGGTTRHRLGQHNAAVLEMEISQQSIHHSRYQHHLDDDDDNGDGGRGGGLKDSYGDHDDGGNESYIYREWDISPGGGGSGGGGNGRRHIGFGYGGNGNGGGGDAELTFIQVQPGQDEWDENTMSNGGGSMDDATTHNQYNNYYYSHEPWEEKSITTNDIIQVGSMIQEALSVGEAPIERSGR